MTITENATGELRIAATSGPLAKGQATAGAEEPRVVCYEGDRIYFSTIEPEDEPNLRRWINDPANWIFLGRRPPLNGVREREWIESQGKNDTEVGFGIVIREGHRLIGGTGLHRINRIARKAELGISIGDRAFQSQGYGSEAVRLMVRYGFEELNLNRISLWVFAHNLRAIRCYQKAGFVHESCLREAGYQGGQYHDIYGFAILRSEWKA
jgi:RimJ/RimL family protein N-acetyltransferase